MADIHKFGRQGERLAADFLLSKGYTIEQRNYRWSGIEIDIIAQNQDYIVFVEVKTRHNRLENPEHFLPKKKQSRMVKLANFYVNSNSIDKEVRFDLIIIDWKNKQPQITHIEQAFLPAW